MIDIKDVTKTYHGTGQPVTAVRNARFSLSSGEFASIVGHSGSGKSTLISMIGGILRPDSGTVTVDGENIWTYPDDRLANLRNSRFAFVYQFASLIPTLTIEENVLLPTIFGGTAVLADAERLLEMVGLKDKIKRYPSELSGGEQQRVAIARAFINDPAIVLADEPTGDLDEETEADIIRFFERFNSDKRTTIIMVTHNSDLAARASRRFRMKAGIIEERS
ncbi:MAG: ABC transporter ATP-binding protein [Nitrospirota bacterium]|nr:ABC transporter ATP-binding protein [Nitrospirota bacterium]